MKLLAPKNIIICTEASHKTESGIEQFNGSKKPETGIVYAVGSEKELGDLPIDLKPGDEIVFRKYTDNNIMVRGVSYNFIRFEDLVGKVVQE